MQKLRNFPYDKTNIETGVFFLLQALTHHSFNIPKRLLYESKHCI